MNSYRLPDPILPLAPSGESAALLEALRRNERMLAEAQELAHIGSWEWDVRSNRIDWSDELYRIYGRQPQSFAATYEAFIECVHPDDRRTVDDAVRGAFVSGDRFEFRHRVVRPDGTVRMLHGRGRVERDETGAVLRMLGTGQDVSELVALEEERERRAREQARREAAEAAERRARFLARAIETLTASLDYESTLAAVASLAVPDYADYCAVDLMTVWGGRPARVAIAHRDPARVDELRRIGQEVPWNPNAPTGVARVIRTREPELVERVEADHIGGLAEDEEHRARLRGLNLASWIVVPLVTHGRTLGALVLATEGERGLGPEDLTLAQELARPAAVAIDNARLHGTLRDALTDVQRQAAEMEAQATQLEENAAELEMVNDELRVASGAIEARNAELESAREEAESANRTKGEFLSRMSHELRTPLNASLGYIELLLLGIRGPLSDAQRQDLERMQRSQRHLLGLVSDILDFARVERGGLEYRIRDVPVDPLLRELDALVGPELAAKGLDYAVEPCPGLVARADGEKLRQVVLNLLTNALKFTDAGGRVRVAARRDGERVLVSVTDSGWGIAPAHRERVFEPFVQIADRRATSSRQGVGLGLAISRDLARAMEGDLVVESEPGVGSVFTVSIPASR